MLSKDARAQPMNRSNPGVFDHERLFIEALLLKKRTHARFHLSCTRFAEGSRKYFIDAIDERIFRARFTH
ncbi:unknown [Eggerthella sp. CAG:298]|nr:unknown [Eggerthella sp. CAG:298]